MCKSSCVRLVNEYVGSIEIFESDVMLLLQLFRERSKGCSVVSAAILHEDSPSNSVELGDQSVPMCLLVLGEFWIYK